MLETIVAILALCVLAIAAAWFYHHKVRKPAKSRTSEDLDTLAGWAPQATRLLSVAERNAHDTLCRALPDHLVFAQVPVARFVKVPTRHSYGEWLRRIGNHCVDLVVADSLSRVVAVIELRKSSSDSDRTQRRNERLERVLKTSGIPLHVWQENALPSVTETIALLAPPSAEPPVAAPPAMQDVPVPATRQPSDNVPFYIAKEPLTSEANDTREAPPSTWFDDLDELPSTTSPPDSRPAHQTSSQFGHRSR